MNWDNFECGICGGEAYMGIMSLVARCSECAAYSVDYPPTQWEMQCAGGSD